MTVEEETCVWVVVGHLDDLWEGDMLGVEVAGQPVLLVNINGDVRAYRNRCPHQAWPLADGDLEGATLTCVRHMWAFDVVTGCGVNPTDTQLTSYTCKVDDDGAILVDIR